MSSARISPTAHYTGHTWVHHGLAHPAFATTEGRVLHLALEPMAALSRRLGLPTLEGLLLARHHAMDAALGEAIDAGRIGQVIEVAAGLSPRGWEFCRRHGARLRYIEADLPGMAARKRALLARAGLQSPRHEVVDLDALANDGPQSLARLADRLDPGQGLAIITEGLVNYFPTEAVIGMWQRFAATLQRFPAGLYLSDLHLQTLNGSAAIQAFTRVLSTFVRGRVHLHFRSTDEALAALHEAGFPHAALIAPPAQPGRHHRPDRVGAATVRVVRASTGL